MLNHIKKYLRTLNTSYGYGHTKHDVLDPTDRYPANVNISTLENSMHGIALDIDLPCELIPSRTPGHFHLYIDKELPWKSYLKLLDALVEAGIVEEGWVEAAKRSGHTTLRLPPDEYEFQKIRERMQQTGKMF